MSLPFFIPDTSPLFAYSPCANCAAPNAWSSSYGPRGDGYDQTFHQASGSDSSISINITASSLEFRTSQSGGNCDARYSLDNGDLLDGCVIPSFPEGRHSVRIQPKPGVSSFQLYGIAGTSIIGSDKSYQNSTMDDTSPFVTYSGQWTQITAKGPSGQAANATVADQYSGGNGFYNASASISTAAGSAINLKFQGQGVYVYGMAGPDGGAAEVKIDGVLAHTLNMTNPWRAYSALMFFATGMEAVQHEITITNLVAGRQFVLDYALVTKIAKKSSGPNLTLIIGTIAGVSAFLLIVSVILYIYITRRQSHPRRPSKSYQYGFANGFSYRDISPAKASSIDSWRKNAQVSSTPHTPSSGSASGSSASNGRFYAAHLQPAAGGLAIASPGRSPPPDYPDYLPYRGPIEPRSITPVSDEPPAIAGLTASTHGWLASAITSPSPQDHTARSPRRPVQQAHRPDPIPLFRNGARGAEEDIPLDSYYATQDLISPASTMSSLGLSGMTTRAMGATRSVARLWPTSVVASGPDSTVNSTVNTVIATPPSAQTRRDRVISIDSLHYAPTYTTAGHFVTSPDQLLGSGVTTASLNAMRQRDSPSQSSMRDPSSSSLRRGVSIKSVKTMRSFFSGLLGGSPLPNTPALPSAYIPYETPAARPDSDIFPNGSISRSNSAVGNGGLGRFGIARTPSSAGMNTRSIGAGKFRNKSRGTLGSSGLPPMLRLDAGGENFFIELNPNSPITVVDGSRPQSEMTAVPSSWRSPGRTGNRI